MHKELQNIDLPQTLNAGGAWGKSVNRGPYAVCLNTLEFKNQANNHLSKIWSIITVIIAAHKIQC